MFLACTCLSDVSAMVSLPGAGCAAAAGRLLPEPGGLVLPERTCGRPGHMRVPVVGVHIEGTPQLHAPLCCIEEEGIAVAFEGMPAGAWHETLTRFPMHQPVVYYSLSGTTACRSPSCASSLEARAATVCAVCPGASGGPTCRWAPTMARSRSGTSPKSSCARSGPCMHLQSQSVHGNALECP